MKRMVFDFGGRFLMRIGVNMAVSSSFFIIVGAFLIARGLNFITIEWITVNDWIIIIVFELLMFYNLAPTFLSAANTNEGTKG